jgi:hypothetical protein
MHLRHEIAQHVLGHTRNDRAGEFGTNEFVFARCSRRFSRWVWKAQGRAAASLHFVISTNLKPPPSADNRRSCVKFRNPFSVIAEPVKLGRFLHAGLDLDRLGQGNSVEAADLQRREVFEATREGPKSKKPTSVNSWASWIFVVGRAGFEPATNGLKVAGS